MRKTVLTLLASGMTLAVLATSAPAAYASSAYKVTAKVSHSKIFLGGKNVVHGTVSPKAPGKTVKVYVHYASDSSGEYHYVGSDTLDSTSKYSKKFEPKDSGRTKIKVVKAKSGSHKAGSAGAYFDNYGKLVLSNLPRTVERGVVQYSATYHFFDNNSDADGFGFIGSSGAQARWDTHYQCTRFVTNAGIEDSSPTGTSAIANFVGEKADKSTLTIVEGSLLADGQDQELIDLNLRKKVGNVIKTARYIDISTQAFSGNPTYIAAWTELTCNLPGGAIEGFYDE